MGEAIELCRSIDTKNRKEEAGDLMSSLLQLMNEEGWEVDILVKECLEKINRRQSQYKTLGRKIKIALLGTAADPITNGHIQVAQFVLNTSKTFDEAWILPCFSHLYNKKMASPKDRLNMCELAVQVDGRIKVFDYEIKNKLSGETYHTAVSLINEDFAKDKYDFSFIIGLDNANTFDKWVNYEHLEQMVRFVVVPRKGVERDKKVNWYLKPPHIFIETDNFPVMDISSSLIRKNIKEGISCEGLIDPKVEKYIISKNLYKN
jgi:nicotinate-nucleotide adenylyltransferase